jgi:hypothetical protein
MNIKKNNYSCQANHHLFGKLKYMVLNQQFRIVRHSLWIHWKHSECLFRSFGTQSLQRSLSRYRFEQLVQQQLTIDFSLTVQIIFFNLKFRFRFEWLCSVRNRLWPINATVYCCGAVFDILS